MKTETTMERELSPRVSAPAVLACAWPALLVAAICLLPFLNKAFNIDDPHFLEMARQIVTHPMHPMDFRICWDTTASCAKAYNLTPGNALMGYALVPTVLIGAHEWMAHLSQLFFALVAIVAMASLVLRLGWDKGHAAVGALLLAAIPPFLVMATTAMPDVLAAAVALVAMERTAAWKAEQRWSQGAAAALALGFAGFARSHLALLLPLAAFFLFDSVNPKEMLAQIRRKPQLWLPVVAGSALLAVIILSVREHNLAINPPPVVIGGQHILQNLRSYLLYMVFPLPLAACWFANCLWAGRLRTVAILAALAIVPWPLHWYQPLGFSLSIVGCGVLTSLIIESLKKRDHTSLFLLLWLLIPLPIIYYVQLPMKYLVPCLPAVIFLCFRLMKGLPVRVARFAAVTLIVASTGYSILILRSDAEFANYGRDALYRLIGPHVAAGEKVWFPGQYWSYWYAPLAGATLTPQGGPQPQPGDLLVVDRFSGGANPPLNRFPHRTLVESVTHRYSFGRTMGAGVGLYDNGHGSWLWGFGEDENDRFELWRID
jgi:4-amino-4-deoxy-L-arabinose transferase-like glycosyltransferase